MRVRFLESLPVLVHTLSKCIANKQTNKQTNLLLHILDEIAFKAIGVMCKILLTTSTVLVDNVFLGILLFEARLLSFSLYRYLLWLLGEKLA